MDFYDDYEREILTMVLADKNGYQAFILNALEPEMFHSPTNQIIFEVCKNLHKAGEAVNKFSVSEFINDTRMSHCVDALYSECISSANYVFYVDRLQKRYKNTLISNAKTEDDLKKIQEKIASCSNERILSPISEGAENLLFGYYNNWETAIKTGFKSIDSKMGSLQGGDYIILAGQTSMGKTCMMLNLVVSIAKQGYSVDIFSLEMSKEQLQNRIICSQTGINSSKFRDFTLSETENKEFDYYARNNLQKLKINIATDYRMTTDKIRQTVKKSDSDIVFIDYLGLISGGNNKNSYERYGDISRDLKLMALESKKPFVVLHQLNRGLFDREDKRPRISDLRDSGKIEQDADAICFVHRPAYYAPDKEDSSLMEFYIAKNRHNQSNVICNLKYDAERQRITDYD